MKFWILGTFVVFIFSLEGNAMPQFGEDEDLFDEDDEMQTQRLNNNNFAQGSSFQGEDNQADDEAETNNPAEAFNADKNNNLNSGSENDIGQSAAGAASAQPQPSNNNNFPLEAQGASTFDNESFTKHSIADAAATDGNRIDTEDGLNADAASVPKSPLDSVATASAADAASSNSAPAAASDASSSNMASAASSSYSEPGQNIMAAADSVDVGQSTALKRSAAETDSNLALTVDKGEATVEAKRSLKPMKKTWVLDFGTGGTGGNNAARNKLRRKFPLAFCELARDNGVICPGIRRGSYVDQFYFDPVENRCYHFVYNGCGGNANRFSSLWECTQSCAIKSNLQKLLPD